MLQEFPQRVEKCLFDNLEYAIKCKNFKQAQMCVEQIKRRIIIGNNS